MDANNITIGLASFLGFLVIFVPMLWTVSKENTNKDARIQKLEEEVADIKKLSLEVTLAEIKFQLKHIVAMLELTPTINNKKL